VRLNSKYESHHQKFFVVDNVAVDTGSFDYFASAVDKNTDNKIKIRRAPEFAAKYVEEWTRLWNEDEDLKQAY
jgi:phosphatidylserine/phosphatidylglycerophosphate/cardiolipin synthase-like enzyme